MVKVLTRKECPYKQEDTQCTVLDFLYKRKGYMCYFYRINSPPSLIEKNMLIYYKNKQTIKPTLTAAINDLVKPVPVSVEPRHVPPSLQDLCSRCNFIQHWLLHNNGIFQKVNSFTVKEMQEDSMLFSNGNWGSYLSLYSRYCLDHIH